MTLLETREVSVRFGGHLAVDEVSMAVEPGGITGLIGPNGAGKTTIFNVISGLQTSTAGKVFYDGKDITKAKTHQRARLGIARTFQRLEVFGSLSVRDNLVVAAEISNRGRGRGARSQRIADELVERVGLGDVAGVRAEELPTGTARLVELGRALASHPRLLLLDEPASGLDEGETEGFATLLQRLSSEGLGILLVEHDVPLVMRLCATVYVLNLGRLLARGTPAEVQGNQEVLDAYLGQGASVGEVGAS